MTEKHRPLALAIKRLFDDSTHPVTFWRDCLDVDDEVIESWFDGRSYPPDLQMVRLLEKLGTISESKSCPELSEAIDAFWTTIEQCEREGSTELTLREGEFLSQRFTRFTNRDRLGEIWQTIGRIPPRRRHEFLVATRRLFEKYTS